MTEKIQPYRLTPSCHCRSCGRPIRFEQTADGRGVPLDIEPVDGGAIDLVRDGPGRRHLESVIPEAGVLRWQAHRCEPCARRVGVDHEAMKARVEGRQQDRRWVRGYGW
jgi:hypothetical protein